MFSKAKQIYVTRLNEYIFVNVQVNIFNIRSMPINVLSHIIRRCETIYLHNIYLKAEACHYLLLHSY